MKKRVLAMIAAITIAAGSIAIGGTSYAAEEISFDEEILVEDEIVEEENSWDDVTEEASDAAEEANSSEESDESAEDISASEESSETIIENEQSEDIVIEEDLSEASDEASTDSSEEEELLEETIIPAGMPNPVAYSASAKGRWISKGNKWTYENAKGEAKDDDGNPLDNNLAHIGDNFYYFKGGYMLTGFIYFDEEGNFTASKKANSARYCDLMSGIIKTGMFAVNGKDYYALSDAKAYGLIRYNTIFSYNNNYYYADKAGAILKGKGFSLNGKSYFAKENGALYRDDETLYRGGYAIIDGKMYKFNSDCSVNTDALGPYCYFASKKDGKTEGAYAYILCKNPEKPEEGRCFYADEEGKKKLSSCWIYGAKNLKDDTRLYYLNKKGDMVTGLFTIGGTKYLFGESGEKNCGIFQHSYEGTYESNGKTCLVMKGVMMTKPGFYTSYKKSCYYYVMNKSGELAKGDVFIKTKQYPKGKTYSFGSNYRQRIENYSSSDFVKYIVNHSNYENPEIKGPEDHFVLTNQEEVEQFLTTPEGEAYKDLAFDTDGTLLNGIKTADGKKYLYFQGEPAHVNYMPDRRYDITVPFVIFEDGKGYLIGPDSAAMTGWFRISDKGSVKTGFNSGYLTLKETYMYFSPDTETAVTGIVTAPVPKLDKNGEIVLDSNGNVVTTGEEAELCFAIGRDRKKNYFDGYLVRNDEYTVDGKVYITDGAGVAKLLKEGPVYKDGETIYKNADGSTSTGRKGGCYYDPETGYQLKNVIRCSSKKWYYYGKDGKESTALTEVTLDDGQKAFVTYNKNGSINSFKYENGKKVSKRAFTLGASYYFVGKTGTLTTGFVNQKLVSKNVDVTTYVESDGNCYYKNSAYAGKTFMVKSGKKLYVMESGALVKDSTKAYKVSDFSRLPKADLAIMERYQSQACVFADDDDSVELEKYGLPIYVNDDGSVSEKTITRDGRELHINKYGVCFEELSPFRRVGKNWYYTLATETGSISLEAVFPDNKGSFSNERTLTFSWDNNMKLGKFIDASTGKPMSGFCFSHIVDPVTNKDVDLHMYLKDGKLATGKRVYRIPTGSASFYYDHDTGVMDYMDYYRMIIKNNG